MKTRYVLIFLAVFSMIVAYPVAQSIVGPEDQTKTVETHAKLVIAENPVDDTVAYGELTADERELVYSVVG